MFIFHLYVSIIYRSSEVRKQSHNHQPCNYNRYYFKTFQFQNYDVPS